MEQGIEEAQVEASSYYNLEHYEQETFHMTEECIFNIKEPKGIHSVKFNYNDQYIAAGYRDSMVRIFNLMTKNTNNPCELDCSNGNPKENLVQVMKWRPKIEGRTNNILMTACKDTIMEWHTASRQIVHKKTFQDNIIYSMDYSNDGMQYALGFKDYSIRVYDGVTKKEEVKLGGYDNHRVTGHTGKICALKYHKDDPKVLLSGGSDGNILVWDLSSGTIIDLINGPSILGEGLDMNAFGEVLSASWKKDEPLQLWDFDSKKLKMSIDWNAKEKKEDMKASTQLYCCKFSNDFGKLMFAGGSLVNAAKVFDWSGKCLASVDKLSHAVISIDCSNDVTKKEQLLAIGGGEGSIRVFKYTYIPPTN